MLVRTPLSALDRSFDRTFDQLTAGLFPTHRGVTRRSAPPMPEVRAHWEGAEHDELVLTVDLPGVAPDAVAVEVAGRSLTLQVQTDRLQWSRQLQLGPALDPDKVSARHVNGQLTVHIGGVDAPQARRVAIDTTAAPMAAAVTEGEGEGDAATAEAATQGTETSSGADQPTG